MNPTITYGWLHFSRSTMSGMRLEDARKEVESLYDKGYIASVVRFVDGEIDLDWEDAR